MRAVRVLARMDQVSGGGHQRVHREGTIVLDFTQAATKHLVYRAVGENRCGAIRFR